MRRQLTIVAFFLHGARMGSGALYMLLSGVWSPSKVSDSG
jgi:hypothetical protein